MTGLPRDLLLAFRLGIRWTISEMIFRPLSAGGKPWSCEESSLFLGPKAQLNKEQDGERLSFGLCMKPGPQIYVTNDNVGAKIMISSFCSLSGGLEHVG